MSPDKSADHTRPTDATRSSEQQAAHAEHAPDRAPSGDEERAAEENRLSPETSEHYKEMAERGASQKGEGRLPG